MGSPGRTFGILHRRMRFQRLVLGHRLHEHNWCQYWLGSRGRAHRWLVRSTHTTDFLEGCARLFLAALPTMSTHRPATHEETRDRGRTRTKYRPEASRYVPYDDSCDFLWTTLPKRRWCLHDTSVSLALEARCKRTSDKVAVRKSKAQPWML